MLEIGIITTGVIALTALIGIFMLVGWCRSEVTARGAALDSQRLAEQRMTKAESERDEHLAAATKATAERDLARREAFLYAQAAQSAREELTKYVRERLAGGSDDDVLDVVNGLLGAPMPTVRTAPEAVGDRDSEPGASSVPDSF